jgi:protein TonB
MINISAGVAVGLLAKHDPPTYPAEAKAAGVSGTVVLQALIGTDGHVDKLDVISGPAVLQQAALDAVRKWVYRPYLLNCEPILVNTVVNVVFILDKHEH